MKIKTKILGIVLLVYITIIFSILITGLFTLRAQTVLLEEDLLSKLRSQLISERQMASDFLFENLLYHTQNYDETIEGFSSAAEIIDQMKYLPGISIKTRDALDNIKSLDALLAGRRADFTVKRDLYLEEVDLIIHSIAHTFNYVLNADLLYTHEAYPEFVKRKNDFYSSAKVMITTIDTSLDLLDSQTASINSEVLSIKRSGLIISVIIIAIMVLISLLLSFRIIASIVKSVRGMKERIGYFMEGDLSKYIESSSKDEIGDLSRNLNEYRISLNDSFCRIKEVSKSNMETKESLKRSVIQSHNALKNVETSVQAIDNSSGELASTMDSAVSAVKSTFDLVEDLSGQISDQFGMVEETSSAITEIISSVDSISQMTDNSRQRMGELVDTSRDGREKLQETKDVISLINGSVEVILGMVEMIENISSQTDLLSMNAAIEAAHAGEAGRGFSVVAEEIGKLAEVASSSTQEMSTEISHIVDMIRKASDTSEITAQSFEQINSEIEKVDRVFSEIHMAIKELKQGGGQIQNTTVQLRDFSAKVENTSREISGNTQKVMEGIETVDKVTGEVKQESHQIVENMELIQQRMGRVEDASKKIEKGSETMDSILERFKTIETE